MKILSIVLLCLPITFFICAVGRHFIDDLIKDYNNEEYMLIYLLLMGICTITGGLLVKLGG